jgi:pyruvate kinase
MKDNHVKKIITLGPATDSISFIKKMKERDVDFVRINMSHSSLDDLSRFIDMANDVGVPFIVDTEGSQIRMGDLEEFSFELEENDLVEIHSKTIIGNKKRFSLTPSIVVNHLELGDLIHIDFDTCILQVMDISRRDEGVVIVKPISRGYIGRKKAVIIDSALPKKLEWPCLSEKDKKSIEIGLSKGVKDIAVSFVRSGDAVREVRELTQGKMRITSKVECIEALDNIEEIIDATDSILLDRGDLSKDIPIERIPLTQKRVISLARKKNVDVFIATNLLETMVDKRKPTRAEICDIVNSILDGAKGLVLSAETAVGKYPVECVNIFNKLIAHVQDNVLVDQYLNTSQEDSVSSITGDYLTDYDTPSSLLIKPHGGRLSLATKKTYTTEELSLLPRLSISEDHFMDLEQIALGAYSPLSGFMNKENLKSVLDNMRLVDGTIWPLPILLDVHKTVADTLKINNDVALCSPEGEVVAVLELSEKFEYSKSEIISKIYNTDCKNHPGVKMVNSFEDVFLAGKVNLIKRREHKHKGTELTPSQMRRLFEEKGWSKVVGFHTRNVPHRGHESAQLSAMEDFSCDGLLVHPVIGKKKQGDFRAEYIISTYEKLISNHYPDGRVIFGSFSTFSRYAGPREALFTAICRKNFGCSHFVVGRDHTGVGSYYDSYAAHEIFDKFPDLDMKIVKLKNILYLPETDSYKSEDVMSEKEKMNARSISGTEVRNMIISGTTPPEWMMRNTVSEMLIRDHSSGRELFC